MQRLTLAFVFGAAVLTATTAPGAAIDDLPAADTLARGFPSQPLIAGDGTSVGIIWRDEAPAGWTWWMRRSTDSGRTFAPAVPLRFLADPSMLRVTGAGDRMHFCWSKWSDSGGDGVHYAYIDVRSGAASPVRLLSSDTAHSMNCNVFSSQGRVAVMWQDVSASLLLSAMLLAYSGDGGDTFQNELEIGWALGGFPRIAFPETGRFVHVAWTTDDVPDRGVWHAQVDVRSRTVRKRRVLPNLGPLVLKAARATVVVGAGRDVLVSSDSGSTFDKRTDIDPPAPSTPLDSALDGRIGLTATAVYADASVLGVVATKDFGGEVYFSASHDGGTSFSRPLNLSEQGFPSGQRSSMEPWIAKVGSTLAVTWAELDGPKQQVHLAFRTSPDMGRTFGVVRRTAINTRDGSTYSPPVVHASGGALVFAWSEPGDSRRKHEGALRLLRVTP